MKKWFLYLASALIALVLFSQSASAGSLNIMVSSQAKKGDKVVITIEASDYGEHVSLFITNKNVPGLNFPTNEEICQEANSPSTTPMKLKKVFYPNPILMTWEWDTGAENTSIETHQIIAVQMDTVWRPEQPSQCDPNKMLSLASETITITSADTPEPDNGEPSNGENGGAPDIKFPNIVIKPPKGKDPGGEDITRPELNEDNFTAVLMKDLIERFLQIGAGLALIALVYSGIMYITSAGEPQKAENAKKNLIWAIIAIVIMLLGLLIVQTIPSILS